MPSKIIDALTSFSPSLSESVAALFMASLKSTKVLDELVVICIWSCPLDVKLCPPPLVGSADQVPKLMVSVLAPTVAVGELYDGPVRLWLVARVVTVKLELMVEPALEPEAVSVATVASELWPTNPYCCCDCIWLTMSLKSLRLLFKTEKEHFAN